MQTTRHRMRTRQRAALLDGGATVAISGRGTYGGVGCFFLSPEKIGKNQQGSAA